MYRPRGRPQDFPKASIKFMHPTSPTSRLSQLAVGKRGPLLHCALHLYDSCCKQTNRRIHPRQEERKRYLLDSCDLGYLDSLIGRELVAQKSIRFDSSRLPCL